jgi:DNA-directed RNA polymerase subunit E'/Rpb7
MENTTNLKNINYKKKKEQKIQPIYSKSLITRSILIPIKNIGKNIKQIIEKYISDYFEGKCIVEGYVKSKSCNVISYSSGLINHGVNIMFEVVFECDVCFPVEGSLLSCIAKNVTKAGIRCESSDEVPSPIIIFIARDHHYNNNYFSSIQEDDKIMVRVIGQRFELNDKYISIIGELVIQNNNIPNKNVDKKKLIIEN